MIGRINRDTRDYKRRTFWKDLTPTMALQQKLAAFLETRDLKELKGTEVDIWFEFVRGEMHKRRLWKFIVVTELLWKLGIGGPIKSVDKVEGSYVEKTKYIRDVERFLTESFLETLAFRIVTAPHELHVSADMLNPHAYSLIEWIMYGNQSIANEATRVLHPDGYTTYTYEGYKIKIAGDIVLKCTFLNHQ